MSELKDRSEDREPLRMHRVKYELRYKKNLGNFENIDISVGLEQDGFGHPDITMAKVREWVEDNLGVAVIEVVASVEDK